MTSDADVVRVMLPSQLQVLAGVGREVEVPVPDPVTTHAILDALESELPALRGTLRDPRTRQRRPRVRFFACGEDYSNAPADTILPAGIASGHEPFLVVGAISGG